MRDIYVRICNKVLPVYIHALAYYICIRRKISETPQYNREIRKYARIQESSSESESMGTIIENHSVREIKDKGKKEARYCAYRFMRVVCSLGARQGAVCTK